MKETVWRREIVRPIFEYLRQCLTPEKLSLTIALGITLGVVPVLGSAVLLCTLAAPSMRLGAWLVLGSIATGLLCLLLLPLLRRMRNQLCLDTGE